MLPNNFANIADEHPDLQLGLAEISGWITRHRDWRLLDPRVLAVDLDSLDAIMLARALNLLVTSGIFRVVYKVTAPQGTLSPDDFDDLESIPERVYDRWDQSFETAGSDIVAILKPAAANFQPGLEG